MLTRLRKILFSTPLRAAVGLVAAYLAIGFLLLPALARWQLEKQAGELGHVLRVGDLRFDPLALRLEVDDLALSDARGAALLAFKQLVVDLELRSVLDGAWTFSEARLQAPVLQLDFARDGRSNFDDLLARLGGGGDDAKKASTDLPPVLVRRLDLLDGRIEWSDQSLDEPLVTRIAPLRVEVQDLSTFRSAHAAFRIAANSDAGEALALRGELGLNPVFAKGRLALNEIRLETLARGFARRLALQSPSGAITLAATFEVALDKQGLPQGGAQDIDLVLAGLSVQAPGARAPLLALQTLAFSSGQVDLAKREARFAQLRLAKGAVAMALDAQGRPDWSGMLRAPVEAAAPTGGAAAAQPPASPAPDPWRLAIDNVLVSDLAFSLRDPARQQALSISAVQFGAAPSLTLSATGTRVALGRSNLVLTGLQYQDGARAVAAAATRLDAADLSLSFAAGAVAVRIDAPQVALEQGGSASQGEDSASIGALTIKGAALSLDSGSASTRLAVVAPRFALSAGASVRQGNDSATVGALTVEGAGLSLDSAATATRLDVDAPRLQLQDLVAGRAGQSARLRTFMLQGSRLGLQSSDGDATLALETPHGELADLRLQGTQQAFELAQLGLDDQRLSLSQDGTGLALQAQAPALQASGLLAQQGAQRAGLATLSLGGTAWRATRSASGAVGLSLGAVRSALTRLALEQAGQGLDLAQVEFGVESVDLALDDAGARVSGGKTSASISGALARQGQQTLALRDGRFDARAIAAGQRGPADRASGDARIEDAVLTLAALAVGTGAADTQSALAELAGARLSAASLALESPDGVLGLVGQGMALGLEGAVVRDPADPATVLLQLGRASAAGAAFDLRRRQLTVDTLVASQAQARTWLDAQGRLNLLDLAGSVAAAPAAQPVEAPAAPTRPQSAAPGAWRVALKAVELDGVSVAFEDRRRTPPFALAVQGAALRASNLDTAAAQPTQVALTGTLASGGRIDVAGTVGLATGSADLQLELAAIALAPVQAYLSDFVDLQLASGSASTRGRLQVGEPGGGRPRLAYAGSVSVDQLLLEETASRRPFLAWESVASSDLALTLEPDQLTVGELRVHKPVGRLIIAQDQSVNLTDVIKKRPPAPQGPVAADAAAAAPAPPFPVALARVRVTEGALEFADLSLRPQFGARMHQLKGVVTGLGTDPARSARVQLDARVDRFGSARIRGQVNVMQPDRSTDIAMAFRNLEMTSLSPYVAKFAGYEVASGKLALDLQYKIEDSRLVGENKVVLNQLALGRKVESPNALDIPLELALAILKDANGVIDIGIPVSGDLKDPKFDYGAVIARAIGNLLGGIVTAPFRALAALFGGADKQIDSIEFEPGSDVLEPPQQQKLEAVARALKERPSLLLRVVPVYAQEQDAPALQLRTVREEIAGQMGIALAPGDDPGPVDTADPRAPAAVEAAFNARYAPAVLALLKQRALGAGTSVAGPVAQAPGGAAAAAPNAAPGSAATAPAAPPARDLPGAFYQDLIERMVREQPVSEALLAQLAQRRAQAIASTLTDGDGVPSGRVLLGEAKQAGGAGDKAVVALKLQLEVVK